MLSDDDEHMLLPRESFHHHNSDYLHRNDKKSKTFVGDKKKCEYLPRAGVQMKKKSEKMYEKWRNKKIAS